MPEYYEYSYEELAELEYAREDEEMDIKYPETYC